MTSSFQSTAATRIYDSPVNTFVQPVTAVQKSSMADLAEILQTVNPTLEKFFVNRANQKAEKDRKQAVADVLDAEINGGAIADLSNRIEKVEGRQTAREIIGGTRAYRRQYEKSLVALQAQKRGNRMDSDYDVTRIDTGAKDENGKPILKFLKEFSTDSNEYRTWRKSYLDEDLELFRKLGIDSTVVDDFYIPEMSKEMFKNANYGTKQNQAFEYNKFLGLMPEVLTEASLHLSKGEDDQAGEILNNYLENMYKGGITGTDATKTYTTLIDNIYAQGEKLLDIDVSKPDAAQKLALAESFPDRLLSLVKYGEKDLRSHKDYLTKSAAFDEKFERLVLQKIKYKNQVQPLLNKLEIKNKFQNINKIPLTVDMTDAEKTTAIENKRNGYEALKNDPRFTTKEEQDYIDQLGQSDNYDLKSKIIPDLKKKITLGVFDGLDTDLEKAISDIENNHATMDNEAIDLIDKLKTFAANSDGLGEDIQASTTNIMNIVNDNLGVGDKFQILEPFSQKTRSNMLKSTKLGFEVRDKIKQYYIDYIETNGKRPTSLEIQAIEQQYAVQALASDGKPEFVKLRNQLYPNAENPFKKSERQLYQEKIEGINLNRTVPEGSFGIGTQENERTRKLQQQDTNTNNNFFEEGPNLGSVPQFERRRGAGYGGGMPIEFNLQELLNQENFPDFGGLAELVRGGESLGSGLYNAFNGGTTDTAGEMDITSKTIGEMEQMQADGKVFAVGAYQFTPNVLTEARVYSGLNKDDIMTPENQDRLFWGMLLSGRKRPSLAAYLTGQSDDLNAAHEDLALEFAAIQGPDGKGMYDNDKAGNYARIDANLVRESLIAARKLLMNRE
tara:strand:+ start:2708 stop:5233 length:2526 start_codon:yes stop_codon:yes gene_type:complete